MKIYPMHDVKLAAYQVLGTRLKNMSIRIEESKKQRIKMSNGISPKTKNGYLSISWLIVFGLLIISSLTACGTPSPIASIKSNFQISGNTSAGVLAIERIQLDFGAGKSSTTVVQNSDIKPVATIKFNGIGSFFSSLDFRWAGHRSIQYNVKSRVNFDSFTQIVNFDTNI